MSLLATMIKSVDRSTTVALVQIQLVHLKAYLVSHVNVRPLVLLKNARSMESLFKFARMANLQDVMLLVEERSASR